ncbi:MAG: carbon-nitrogen hydrolase family protein [Candidatus Latescibacteria bacterium]|nr:carbon-nitrogen hydrolase family protein [Candidatus Latescibacterota bacterium]
MSRVVRLAACQMPEIRMDPQQALSLIIEYGDKATALGADLVCFPECYLQGYLANTEAERATARKMAIDLSSPEFESILKKLSKLDPILVFGLIEQSEGLFHNTAVVVHQGKLLGRYRKNHLHGTENDLFTAGTEVPVFVVDGFRFGIMICYDSQFPALAAGLASRGAHLFLAPSNNLMPYEKAEASRPLHAKRGDRCRETGIPKLSADITGERDGRICYGPTALFDTSGEIVAQVPLLQPGLIVERIEIDDCTKAGSN